MVMAVIKKNTRVRLSFFIMVGYLVMSTLFSFRLTIIDSRKFSFIINHVNKNSISKKLN
jgi:hypothetical protein